jgi:hypothetical protein
MKNIFLVLFLSAMMSMIFLSTVIAADEPERIPENMTIEHWSCREVAELGKKYDADKKLPDSVVVESRPCTRKEVADCLMSIIEKVLEKCAKEGADAVPKKDLERIAKLHDVLKPELAGMEGYLTRREEIEKILVAPEVPPFLLKIGVNGFLRGEGVGNFRLPDFSYTPNHSEGRFLYRIKPYAYWHPTDYLDIHLEGQGYGFSGGSQYYGKYSLYQGFAESMLPEKNILALRVGRQEFIYGSAFILGTDSFYDGLSFDAVRLRLQPVSPLTVDILGGWYAEPFSDGLKGDLEGVYITYTFSEGNVLEAYGFRDTGSEDHHPGEHRDTWGMRGTVNFGPVSLEIEPVYQTGRTFNQVSGSNDGIGAYGGHVDMQFELPLGHRKSSLFLSYAISSGSMDAVNGITFRREFQDQDSDTSLVGDINVIGDMSGLNVTDPAGNEVHASGLQVFTLGWGMDLTEKINFSATGHYFLARDVPNGFSRDIGLEADLTLSYTVSENISLIIGYDHFFTGRFFRDASGGGGDIEYGYAMLQFDLSKTWPLARKGHNYLHSESKKGS